MAKTLIDLSQKYENGLVYKSAPIVNKKIKKKQPDEEDDEDEEQRLKIVQLYKAGKYKYSLFNPDNVRLLDKPFP